MMAQHSPFVLGKPIKDAENFYGRAAELRELFESIRNMQPVALVASTAAVTPRSCIRSLTTRCGPSTFHRPRTASSCMCS